MGLIRFTNAIKSCLGQQALPNQKLFYFSFWFQYSDCKSSVLRLQNSALSAARGRGSLIISPIRHFAAVTGDYTLGEKGQFWSLLQKSCIIWREVRWENMFGFYNAERKTRWVSLSHYSNYFLLFLIWINIYILRNSNGIELVYLYCFIFILNSKLFLNDNELSADCGHWRHTRSR